MDPGFTPPAFVALKNNPGTEEAQIPHLQSDHLPLFLYETIVTLNGTTDISLVLPENEDAIVDISSALGKGLSQSPRSASLNQSLIHITRD